MCWNNRISLQLRKASLCRKDLQAKLGPQQSFDLECPMLALIPGSADFKLDIAAKVLFRDVVKPLVGREESFDIMIALSKAGENTCAEGVSDMENVLQSAAGTQNLQVSTFSCRHNRSRP